MNNETQKVDVRRVVPYMQTDSFPTRSAIESKQVISGCWIITGIFDTEKSARKEAARREKEALARIGGAA